MTQSLSRCSTIFAQRCLLQIAIAMICLQLTVSTVAAQATPSGVSERPPYTRLDVFGGYAYLNPNKHGINSSILQPAGSGSLLGATGYINRYMGLQVEGTYFPAAQSTCFDRVQAGPVFRYSIGRFVPYIHALAGGAQNAGPNGEPCTWGWGVTTGLGFDYILPVLHNRLALRPVQADFSYAHVSFGGASASTVTGGLIELSTGVVLRFGAVQPPLKPAVQMGCVAQPVDIFPGEPVTITATVANLNSQRPAVYRWTSTRGQITSKEQSAIVTTAGLEAGDYTVTGSVRDALLPTSQASCTAEFRVHNYAPPTVSCNAEPSTVLQGESARITATAVSPQNRPVTYAYTASSGTISGTTSAATWNSAAAPPGGVEVTCSVVDDLGQSSTAVAAITVSVLPPVELPKVERLCSISFAHNQRDTKNLSEDAGACLTTIALALDQDPTTKVVIAARHASDERPDIAALRALNVADALIQKKAIAVAKIRMISQGDPGQTVDVFLVPQGASFSPADATTIDANSLQRDTPLYTNPSSKSAAPNVEK